MLRLNRIAITAVVCALMAAAAPAQEVRATITGLVTDPSGAPVTNAAVTITNTAQNVSVSTRSNGAGNYVTPFLPPGPYRMTVELAGFRKFIREQIVLEAQDKLRLDVQLEVGDLAQSVTVTGEVSQLQTESATRSQVISNELIANVPTQGRNPFQIAWAAPGVIKTGDWRYLRSFDIAGTSNFSVNGGRNRENEVLLDGISNVRGNRTVIHVPTMESVQEFKVVSNSYDSQYGRTGGGVVTIVTKAGGNAFHGNAFEYFQAEELNANQSELNSAGTKKPPLNINTFGVQASGPFYIPKLLDGRNHLFWMVSYEGMRQRSADPGVATFPLMEWRGGDFSSLRNAQNQPVLIYDPLTTAADGSRRAFPENRIPQARISRVAGEVLKFYPEPTSPGTGPARLNNYIYPSRWVADMNQWIGRADYVLNPRNNFFFRYGQNPFSEFRGLVWNGSNAAEPTGNAPLIRNGRNWTFDWTSTLSPRMTFNLRAGLARWEETTGNSFGAGFDPRQLGFADSLVAQFALLQFPFFDLGTYQAIGSSRLIALATNDAYSLQPNANLVVGKHFFKFGGEGRQYNDNTNNPGFASGTYNFRRNWTQRNASTADAVSGNELATFLLGYPSGGRVDRNIDPAYSNRYYALFVNDDWKVSSALTLNFGLRWDYEAPVVERYNRQLRGFDFGAASPIAARAQGLGLRGAVQFAGAGGQPGGAFQPDRNNFQPRVGAAYRIGQKWVLRGGYGLFYLGQNESGAPAGFSRGTEIITTQDAGLTPAVNLLNPFANQPGGLLLAPIGAGQGAASFLGENINVNYLDRPLPYSHQYSFDVERELPGNLLLEVAYVGNLTRKLPVGINVNVLPAAEMGRRTAAGATDTAYYTARLTNPLAGLIPNNAGKNQATIPRQDLLLPFPHFGNINLQNVPIGRQHHHGFQTKITRRFARGLTFLASYSINKTIEQVSLLNSQDFALADPQAARVEKRSATQIDIPQKFAVAGVFELPLGRKKAFGADMPAALDFILGGWQLNWDITYQRGWAVDYPNANQVKPGSASLSDATLARRFDTTLWVDPATSRNVPALDQYTLRDFPTRFGDVRVPGYRNWDASLSKYFPIREQVRVQFRFEMINAFNHPWFSNMADNALNVTNANFGRLSPVQRNLPRFIKLALNLAW